MPILTVEHGIEGADVRIYATAREAIQAMDSPGEYTHPDEIYFVKTALKPKQLRSLAAQEGEPLPLTPAPERDKSEYGDIHPGLVNWVLRKMREQSRIIEMQAKPKGEPCMTSIIINLPGDK
jgi:hypothetical protein